MSKVIKMIDIYGTVVDATRVEVKMMEYCNQTYKCETCKYLDLCTCFLNKYGTVPYRFKPYTEERDEEK